VTGSDSHHPSGSGGSRYPGSHFTWVKMGSPSIEGLRLALLDGPLSVLRSDQVSEDPNVHAPTVLESIEISEARYFGRSQPFTLEFNPWLNTVIGGRGTGKSTLLEFMRLPLERRNELPASLAPEFENYGQSYLNREDGGLLTPNAKISVIYRKDDSRFRILWAMADSTSQIMEQIEGSWVSAEGDVKQRFPVRIFSQKQIFQLAKTPLALLEVVDEAPEVGRASWSEKWNEEEVRFLSLRARAREIEPGLDEESRLRGELDDVKRKLLIFEDAGHADVLRAFQARSRQQQALKLWEQGWLNSAEELRRVATQVVPDPFEDQDFSSESVPESDLIQKIEELRTLMSGIKSSVADLASEADQAATEWEKNKAESAWKQKVDEATRAYQDLRADLDREDAGDPAAYGELVGRRQEIEARLTELEDRKAKVESLGTEAAECLVRLSQFRKELTSSRREFLDSVLGANQYVRIQVLPYGASETVEAELRHLIQRDEGGFEKDIGSPGKEGLLKDLYSGGSEQIEQALLNIRAKIRDIATGETDAEDRRFASHVSRLRPEVFDRLDLWFPEDSLEVHYSPSGDGRNLRPILEGSPGQKTAALLAFLLSYGEEPLILDQPEDDLDNNLIYELIVTQLRQVKRHRQVIVVSHNANIVVNGDAELVVALEARAGQTQKSCEGSLQEGVVRQTVCTVMEGGSKAFEQRYRRIALDNPLASLTS
jgi:hypothetical protein